jgi:hypothetical protein
MLLQSVAGLAAKAVNEGRGDELVWVETGSEDVNRWYAGLVARQTDLEIRGPLESWELVRRYVRNGIVKGYILYKCDRSKSLDDNVDLNVSCNIATSLAGLLEAVIVDEEIEPSARAQGLTLLADVRDKTQQWCFDTYKDKFNCRMLCTQHPLKPHIRDLAIAHSAFTVYGNDEPTPAAMQWLEPLSPVLGWNGSDEFETTNLSTSYGQIQTATDWCWNLPVLMSGSEKLKLPKSKSFDPRSIDWADSGSKVSFVATDGDNVQWLQGNFFGNRSYWGNPDRGKIPFGWSCCFDQLSQLCPQAIAHAIETQTPNDSLIEWGGGYYYPDRFGRRRADRWGLLARHARSTWQLMEQTNTQMIGFNFAKIDSLETRKACEVFAAQTDRLLAILAFQYAPYEGGEGKVFWVRDRNGIEVPVISARYSIWEHANNRDRAGTPAKVAREIQGSVKSSPPDDVPRYDWIIVHAWSFFKHAPGTDENAENMPQEQAPVEGGIRGYTPAVWCADRLPSSIRTIRPEELAWRIRMKHNAEQTRHVIAEWK